MLQSGTVQNSLHSLVILCLLETYPSVAIVLYCELDLPISQLADQVNIPRALKLRPSL